MTDIDTRTIKAAIRAINQDLADSAEKLTALDGQLGDGDLGITLRNAFQRLAEHADALPPELDQALRICSAHVMEASSSSFGTLLATALLAAAKRAGPVTSIGWQEMPELLDFAIERMMVRGKANLGDKTVLDAMHAASSAMRGSQSPQEAKKAALESVDKALQTFRDKPCLVGRARIFADRSAGLDDPGMVAFSTMVKAVLRADR